MKITNTQVYGLEESILASGYPMITEMYDEYEQDNLNYWINNDIESIISILDRNKNIDKYHRLVPNDIVLSEENKCAKIITRSSNGHITGEFLIDYDDIIKIHNYKWTSGTNGYAYSQELKTSLHRVIINPDESDLVDHINRNTFDCRKSNLRITDNRNNCRNNNGLGHYETKEEALKARKDGELEYFGEYSKSHEVEYDSNPYDLQIAIKHFNRIKNLSKCQSGTGHDCGLKGIIVQADFTAPEYWCRQADRYTWFNYVSSQSKMHRLLDMDIESQCNQYVCSQLLVVLQNEINFFKSMKKAGASQEALREQYMKIVSNVPAGFEMTARRTTNYLQLKTMYAQRCINKHKLKDWEVFGEWVRSLPQSHLITGGK
ncbi:MAG: hypothetical protein ACRCX2_29940 [Paraclostridium sp.]